MSVLGKGTSLICCGAVGVDACVNLAYALAYAGMEHDVGPGRHVKLFKNGRNQAVRIPREFELPGDEAIIRKEGDKLIIEGVPPKKSLLELLDSWEPIEEEFPEIEDLPADPVDF